MGVRTKRRLGVVTFLAGVLVFGAVSAALAEGVRQRIKFPRGRTSTTISNAVLREEIDEYLLGAKAGQRMTVEISSVEGNAAFLIHTPGRNGMLAGAGEGDDATSWEGELPATGDYVIEVAPTRGNATYRLKVQIR